MKTKKISLIFALILLTVILTVSVAAEARYANGTPEQEPITLDDVAVPLAEFSSMSDDESLLGISAPIEEIEIDPSLVPLSDMVSVPVMAPAVSVTPKGIPPQTGDNALAPIILSITSGFGFVTTAFFIVRKRKMSKI